MLFDDSLFTLDRALRPLFQNDMKRQGARLMSRIATAVNGLNRLEQIVPAVESLGHRHVGYGVQDEHYQTAGAALLWTREQGLGADFTADVKEAGTSCYRKLAGMMQQVAAQPAT